MLPRLALVAIRARPDDDAPRPHLAAQLRAAGNPRGEFIELQCALARDEPRAVDDVASLERSRELLRAHGDDRRAEAGLWPSEAVFVRGFAEELRLLWARLPAPQTRPFEDEVVRRVTLILPDHVVGDEVATMLGRDWLSGVRELRLGDVSNRGRHNPPPLRGDVVRALAASANLPALIALDLSGNRIGDEGAAVLADALRLPAPRRLDLSVCGLGERGLHALAASRALASLTTFALASERSVLASTASVTRALARSPRRGGRRANAPRPRGQSPRGQGPAGAGLFALRRRARGACCITRVNPSHDRPIHVSRARPEAGRNVSGVLRHRSMPFQHRPMPCEHRLMPFQHRPMPGEHRLMPFQHRPMPCEHESVLGEHRAVPCEHHAVTGEHHAVPGEHHTVPGEHHAVPGEHRSVRIELRLMPRRQSRGAGRASREARRGLL